MLCSLVQQKTLTKQGKTFAATPLDLLATSLCALWHAVTATEIQTHSFKTLSIILTCIMEQSGIYLMYLNDQAKSLHYNPVYYVMIGSFQLL